MTLQFGRRSFFRLATALLATGLARARAAQATGPYDGPLIDAHLHLKEGTGPGADGLVSLYDRAGVEAGFLFGQPWPLATAARDRYPDRLVPFLAEGYAHAVHPDSSYTNHAGLEHLLSGSYVRGLGEVILRHSAFRLGASGGGFSAPANEVPADHPALLDAYALAGRFGAPVTVHQEWWFGDELERALRAAPETQFIWAHAGHGSAAVVRRLMENNGNLLADLSARSPWLGPGTVLLQPDGSLEPDWRSLLTDFADRFLVGLDLFVPTHYHTEHVVRMVDYYRGLLGQLDPAVASLIGHENARRLAPPGLSTGGAQAP